MSALSDAAAKAKAKKVETPAPAPTPKPTPAPKVAGPTAAEKDEEAEARRVGGQTKSESRNETLDKAKFQDVSGLAAAARRAQAAKKGK